MPVIFEAFLRWAETAKSQDRARAANALARAFLHSRLADDERHAARIAMTYLLDDPSPHVRLALCEGLCDSAEAPRPIILSLAQDQSDIACLPLLRSPVLTDSDLVDLAGGGTAETRAMIAARPRLSVGVSAALAEVSGADEVVILLENPSASISRRTLRRLAERHGAHDEVRRLLIDRAELPAEARQTLVARVTEALSGAGLVQAVVAPRRLQRLTREAGTSATLAIAGDATREDLPRLVDHLRGSGLLTPAFLMQGLCSGGGTLFVAAVVALSGLDEKRSRAILSGGRRQALRALLESCGLARDVAEIFVEAVMAWRRTQLWSDDNAPANIAADVLGACRTLAPRSPDAAELIDMVERLQIADERQLARDYASGLALVAAE